MDVLFRVMLAPLFLLYTLQSFAGEIPCELTAMMDAGTSITFENPPLDASTELVVCIVVIMNALEKVNIDIVDTHVELTAIYGGIFIPSLGVYKQPLSALPGGEYTLDLYSKRELEDRGLVASKSFTVNSVQDFTANHESPIEGADVSGINVIRGWSCEAESMTFQIDEGNINPILYGQSRKDTFETCGDNDNGYAQIVNWGNIGDGHHTLRIYIDDVAFAISGFTVTTFGEAFLQDAVATRIVEDFPNPGDVTTLTWSEKDQNFVVTGYQEVVE